MGVHQKVDRAARRQLAQLVKTQKFFPTIRQILHFEGWGGPDAIKRKSPAQDEPWHYFDPSDPKDTALLKMISNRQINLTKALKSSNQERAAFEAAWLAHAVVDGLTPAHHYPLEEKLTELRGEGLETRTSYRKKVIISGSSPRRKVRNNWEFWGAKGVMTTHLLFELGVATTTVRLKPVLDLPSSKERRRVEKEGILPMFREQAKLIYDLKMYEQFQARGWTRALARETRQELMPRIVKMVVLAWHEAAVRAGAETK